MNLTNKYKVHPPSHEGGNTLISLIMNDLLKFTAKITGLDTDLRIENDKIKAKAADALVQVSGEMVDSLKDHLYNDWYLAYTPKDYLRRTDFVQFGVPIGGDENLDISVDRSSPKLDFYFEPSLMHKIFSPWSDGSDGMIEWIQHEHRYGEVHRGWKIIKEAKIIIPARPFWNNFVREQQNGGIMSSFVQHMAPQYKVVAKANDKIVDLTESLLKEEENGKNTIKR